MKRKPIRTLRKASQPVARPLPSPEMATFVAAAHGGAIGELFNHDPKAFAAELGVQVVTVPASELESDAGAPCLGSYTPRANVIRLAEGLSSEKRRWVLAHELAHVVNAHLDADGQHYPGNEAERRCDSWGQAFLFGVSREFKEMAIAVADRHRPRLQREQVPVLRYIEDAASVATYGRRQRVLNVRDILPLGTSTTDMQRAANTLYDTGVTYLEKHKDPLNEYDVEVVGLRHVSNGAYRFQVGDTFRVQFDGNALDSSGGTTTALTVDANLYLMGFTRTFASDGSDSWLLTLSNVLREVPNDGNITAQFLSQLQAVKAAPLPYVLFGDNVARFSPDGLDFIVPSDSGVLTATERKVSWYDDSTFTTPRAHLFAAYNSGLSTGYFIQALKTGTDGQQRWGFHDFVSDWDSYMALNQLGGGFPDVWGLYDDADVGILYLTHSGSGYELRMVGSDGSDVKVGVMDSIVKAADESVTTSTSLQDDDHLTFSVSASTAYQFEGVLHLNVAGAGAFKMTFTGPAGSVGAFSVIYGTSTQEDIAAGSAALGSSVSLAPGGSPTGRTARFWGGIQTGGSSGSCTLQWAQVIASGTATVMAGSYLKWQ